MPSFLIGRGALVLASAWHYFTMELPSKTLGHDVI